MTQLDLAQLAGASDRVIVGVVTSQRSHWSENGKYIVTDTVLRVNQAVLGNADDTITVRTLGGKVGDIRMRAYGSAQMQPGQSFLLFTNLRNNQRHIVGMRQGMFAIRRDKAGVAHCEAQP